MHQGRHSLRGHQCRFSPKDSARRTEVRVILHAARRARRGCIVRARAAVPRVRGRAVQVRATRAAAPAGHRECRGAVRHKVHSAGHRPAGAERGDDREREVEAVDERDVVVVAPARGAERELGERGGPRAWAGAEQPAGAASGLTRRVRAGGALRAAPDAAACPAIWHAEGHDSARLGFPTIRCAQAGARETMYAALTRSAGQAWLSRRSGQ
jgi:hypothetical protein